VNRFKDLDVRAGGDPARFKDPVASIVAELG